MDWRATMGPVPLIKKVAAQILVGLVALEHMIGDEQDAVPNGDDRSALASPQC